MTHFQLGCNLTQEHWIDSNYILVSILIYKKYSMDFQ